MLWGLLSSLSFSVCLHQFGPRFHSETIVRLKGQPHENKYKDLCLILLLLRLLLYFNKRKAVENYFKMQSFFAKLTL